MSDDTKAPRRAANAKSPTGRRTRAVSLSLSPAPVLNLLCFAAAFGADGAFIPPVRRTRLPYGTSGPLCRPLPLRGGEILPPDTAVRAATADVAGEPSTRVPAVVHALNSSTKWLVALAHTIAVWSRPRAFVGPYVVVGSIGAVYLTEALKKLFDQRRPDGAPIADPGMPSSHALVTFFAAVSWASVVDPSVLGGTIRVLLVGAAATVAVLRVVCGYHSVAQIAVGAGLGSVLGWGWMLLGEAVRSTNPRLAYGSAFGAYIAGSAYFIAKNMRHWAARDAHH